MDHIQSRLAGWKGHIFNRAGRVTLACSVISYIPTYYIQNQLFSKVVCNSIDKIIKNFIWGKGELGCGFNLINWKTIIKPRNFGGLGIRETRIANVYMLRKLAWQLLCNGSKSWVQIFYHKYL